MSNEMALGRVPLKYRHVYGEPLKKEFWYENIPISRNAHDGSFISCNPKFLAISAESSGGGAFLLLNKSQTGRMSGMNMPRVCGHKAAILDLQWNPFDDHIIASTSEDCTIKLWQIPEDGVSGDLTESLVDLEGHHRRVLYSQWHPSASNILASAAYDHKVLVWDVEHQSIFCNVGCHKDQIMSISWSTDGRLLASSCKDKHLRILDPRSGTEVLKVKAHPGPKAQKSLWLEDDMILSVGFGQCGEREYTVWHMNNFKSPYQRVDIDQSSSTLIPFYDYDTKMVYLVGKGDGNIRYYEFSQNEVHYLNQYTSNTPQRGVGMMPKRDMDQAKCEVTRLYKLHVTNPIVEPISMIAPRRGAYVDDLYPPTNATVPAVSGKDWMAGNNRKPVLVDLLTGGLINPPPSVPTVQLARQTASKTPASIANISHLTSGSSATQNSTEQRFPAYQSGDSNVESGSASVSVLRSPVKKTNGYVRPKSSYELDYSDSSQKKDDLASANSTNMHHPPRSNSGERMENEDDEKEEEVFDKQRFKKMFALFENNTDDSSNSPCFTRFSRKTQSMREPRRNTTSLAETQAKILGLQEHRRNSEVSSQDDEDSFYGSKVNHQTEEKYSRLSVGQSRNSNHSDRSDRDISAEDYPPESSTPANQDRPISFIKYMQSRISPGTRSDKLYVQQIVARYSSRSTVLPVDEHRELHPYRTIRAQLSRGQCVERLKSSNLRPFESSHAQQGSFSSAARRGSVHKHNSSRNNAECVSPRDITRKVVHILPSVPELNSIPVSKNLDTQELRKKCEDQQIEIDNLKKQLYLKNQRILQLENKLDELLVSSGAVDTLKARQFVDNDESRC